MLPSYQPQHPGVWLMSWAVCPVAGPSPARRTRPPCTLLLGEKDQPEVIRCNEEMAARIPGCRLLRRPDCDHFPTLRAPEALVRLVTELCERAPAA
ncbi:alpha/beta hydrolase [Streptomyces cyaneochromogenes]|uniref:Alpha/beta hydrolase n=1 Tax=Streptomyces cyaneochromogenes TaxID=2496836 RepID=A0A3Q9ESZ5_9ACTN|nr:alpha/beta hydrolase [Streptomyces cyaneochromogenes]